MKNIKECPYCLEEFNGYRGVKIHQHYCLTKKFVEMKKVYFDDVDFTDEFRSNVNFIPSYSNPESYFKFMEVGEIGRLKGKRYIFK